MNALDLRLIKPAPATSTGSAAPGSRVFRLGDQWWRLEEHRSVPGDPSSSIDYVCVSYTWGTGRVEHPWLESQTISDRVEPALARVHAARPDASVWIDALCIPEDEPERETCLARMGEIYGGASEVIIVLSRDCATLLREVRGAEDVDRESLLQLERDPWVTRAWTYQELVNAPRAGFVAEGTTDPVANVSDVLVSASLALGRFRDALGCDGFEFAARYPRLDELESLMVDWKMAGHLERTAYQVMSGMARRESLRPEDRFFAMLGSISDASAPSSTAPGLHPAERFMRTCEARGDFSYIYCTAPRSQVPGRRWRPIPSPRFDAVFPWHTWGPGQTGELGAEGLTLHRVRVDPLAAMSDTALDFSRRWLGEDRLEAVEGSLADRIANKLRPAGLKTGGPRLETDQGLVFSHMPVNVDAQTVVGVATGIRMVHGAPALILRREGSQTHRCLGVGLFVGLVDECEQTIEVT